MAVQNNTKFEKPFFSNLDALRFLAAFSVFAFHFFSESSALFHFDQSTLAYKIANLIFSKGTLGVNFFFVLSGFLITYLILWERKQTTFFNLKHFLIRRTLRIWPLYFLIIFIGFILFPAIINGYHTEHSIWYYLFFLANFDEIKVGLSDSINFLTAPWSVAVEEQFYLFWGTLLFILHQIKRFYLWPVLILLLTISLVFGLYHYSSPRILYYHTFSVMSNIIIGSALALAYFQGQSWLFKLRKLKKWQILLIYILGFIMILIKNKLFIGMFAGFEQTCISLFFAFVIFDQVDLPNSFFKMGSIHTFNHLGKISYGLYLYHLLVIYIVIHVGGSFFGETESYFNFILFFVFTVTLTYILSYFSYKYFEKPFLSLKKKFS